MTCEDGLRIACDVMNLFFAFDEWSDVSNEHETRKQVNCIMEALDNPQQAQTEDEWAVASFARQ